MPDVLSSQGKSSFEVTAPLRLSSSSHSAQSPMTEKKPDLERHISHIPQDSDLEEDEEEEEEDEDDPVEDHHHATTTTSSATASGGLKSKLKKLKKRVTHHHHHHSSPADPSSHSAATRSPTTKPDAAAEEYTDKRHDSGNTTTSDFEITPGLGVSSSSHISNHNQNGDDLTAPATTTIAPNKAITPALDRHISSIGPDGMRDTSRAATGAPAKQQHTPPKGISPRLERHISGIPLDDYDSDREV